MKKIKLITLVLLLACLGISVPNIGLTAELFIKIGTGAPGGQWYPYGAKIADLLHKRVKNVSASVVPGGSVINLKNANKNEIQVGMANGAACYNGFNGKHPFDKKLSNIRGLGIVGEDYFHAIVRKDSDIESFADLRDKKIVPGAHGGFSSVTTENVLKAYDLSFDKVRAGGGTISTVSYVDAADMMKDKNVDFIGYVVGIPNHTVISLTVTVPIRLLSIDEEHLKKILKIEPAYTVLTMPAGTYKGVDTDTVTLGTNTQFMCHKDLPEEIVYQITKIIFEDLPKDKDTFKQFGKIEIAKAYADVKIPMHPGAERYFKEQKK